MIDIDHFKQSNNQYTHDVDDQILKQTSSGRLLSVAGISAIKKARYEYSAFLFW